MSTRCSRLTNSSRVGKKVESLPEPALFELGDKSSLSNWRLITTPVHVVSRLARIEGTSDYTISRTRARQDDSERVHVRIENNDWSGHLSGEL